MHVQLHGSNTSDRLETKDACAGLAHYLLDLIK